MKQATTANTIPQRSITRGGYSLLLLVAIYLLIRGDLQWATINLGMALAFDPFDPQVRWNHRPLYQRVWLFVHLLLVLAGFLYLLFK